MKKMFITAFAQPRNGNQRAERNAQRQGRAGANTPGMLAPRAGESASDYYRRTGMSALGGNARTRGVRPVRIRPRG